MHSHVGSVGRKAATKFCHAFLKAPVPVRLLHVPHILASTARLRNQGGAGRGLGGLAWKLVWARWAPKGHPTKGPEKTPNTGPIKNLIKNYYKNY